MVKDIPLECLPPKDSKGPFVDTVVFGTIVSKDITN